MNTDLASKRSFVLVVGCLAAIGAVAIDISLPAFPEMVRELATSMSTGQQVVGLFMAGIAIGQIPAGLISDRIGRIPVLYGGIGVFTIAAIVCAVTDSISVLLLARFVQGIGCSAGMVLSRAIVRDISSGINAARLMSIMVMIFTIGPLLAPVVGAFLVYQWGWRSPFVAVAVFGAMILLGINTTLPETHRPTGREHPVRQLSSSLRQFFSHRSCIFGLLISVVPGAGFLAMITAASAIVIEIYDFPVQMFGLIFALWGVSFLIAGTLGRRLVLVHGIMRMIGLGAILIGIASLQLLMIAWLGQVSFWWLWGNVCLFGFGVGILIPSANALALDPVPQIAGVASSIIGTLQSVSAATGSLVSSAMYDGTIRNVAFIMGLFGAATTLTYFARNFILDSGKVVRPGH